MARTRTIDADKLIQALQVMPLAPHFDSQYGYTNYSNSEIERVIDNRIQGYILGTMKTFKMLLEHEINQAAVLHGPCMLCAPKEHDVFPEGCGQQ